MKRSGDSFCLQLSSTHRKMSPCLPTEKESIFYEIYSVWQDVLMFQVFIYIQLYNVSIDINMRWSGLQWSVMLHLAPTFSPGVQKVQFHIFRAPMRCECSPGAKQHSNTNQMCEHLHSSTVKFCEGLSHWFRKPAAMKSITKTWLL